LIDRYESEIVHDRTVRNLWRWLGVEPRLQALVAGRRAPEFHDRTAALLGGSPRPERSSTRSGFAVQGPASEDAGGTVEGATSLRTALLGSRFAPQDYPGGQQTTQAWPASEDAGGTNFATGISRTAALLGGSPSSHEEASRFIDQQQMLSTPHDNVIRRERGYLPHLERSEATYFVTFHLADSLPRHVLRIYESEHQIALKRQRKGDSDQTAITINAQYSERIEKYLDAGAGACALAEPEIATLVADTLRHFDGVRYRLHCWCVMPNHVHVVVQPLEGHALSDILHSWKTFTAREANRLLGTIGVFWRREYYDHLIRDEADYQRIIQYVLDNPLKANLQNWRWVEGPDTLLWQDKASGKPESASEDAGGTNTPLPLPSTFNPEQRLTVERALAARDFLLIQGPPGTGKTSVVAEIARQAIARGERVLLAAFTNQAVDNALRRLLAVGMDDFVRLGHALSVAPEIHPYLLMERTQSRLELFSHAPNDKASPQHERPIDAATVITPAQLRETLLQARLVAATTATWSAERFDEVGEP
ncbi:MAG TPA: AAA domain-containing protein, partial [Ktedonobacterales bacterium]|nr:AAA domain-containing protein [Ktedonobacterales bacterium]